MELLAVEHEAREDTVFVQARGDIDSISADELSTHLTAALELAATHAARLLIVDLHPVTFLGSAGLTALLNCHEQAQAAGASMRVVAYHGRVLQPIQVTELDRILDIYPTVSDALRGRQP